MPGTIFSDGGIPSPTVQFGELVLKSCGNSPAPLMFVMSQSLQGATAGSVKILLLTWQGAP